MPTTRFTDYDRAHDAQTWTDARRRLDGLPSGRRLNIAYEGVYRHAAGLFANIVAIRFRDRHARSPSSRTGSCSAGSTASDGATGARFLGAISRTLGQPKRM